MFDPMDQREWLETDGLGGFASGTIPLLRTRRYHGLLVAADGSPSLRRMLVNGCEVFVTTPAGRYALSNQCYGGGVIHPDGARHLRSFVTEPWPTWRFDLPDGTAIEHELFMPRGEPTVAMAWRLLGEKAGVSLCVRPLLSGRDYHALHHENPDYRFDASVRRDTVSWRAYAGIPAVLAQSNARYTHEPLWYRNFFYTQERQRGFDAGEDLASPGRLEFDLSADEAVLMFSADRGEPVQETASRRFGRLRRAEAHRRARFASPLHRAADQYLVRRGQGLSVIAGYPWFADWGRDTFISLRGLCLATGRLEEARQVLLAWASVVSRGMLPNRFSDAGQSPEYNSVDASLWYVVVVHEFLSACQASNRLIAEPDRAALRLAVTAILEGYRDGTRFGIRMDDDGLLAAGVPGTQLTWMDARIGQHVVTPRIGKPVEVQALWINALTLAGEHDPRWRDLAGRALTCFRWRFWNPRLRWLHDVVDTDHQAGAADSTLRPNQVLAVGGLPLTLLTPAQARRVVEVLETRLLTPVGLRSLAAGEPGYAPRYEGGPWQRDLVYHQGTVWPWLIGAFVEAWLRVQGNTAAHRREARQRFVTPLLRHLKEAGLNHVSEIADAAPPHTPRGCPFQAWSVAELLRLDQQVLAEPQPVKDESASHRRRAAVMAS